VAGAVLLSVASPGGQSAAPIAADTAAATPSPEPTAGAAADEPATTAADDTGSEADRLSPVEDDPPAPDPVVEAEPPLPVRVRIPTIGVDADITELGLNPDRTLEVPSDFDETGWWTGRSVPGEPGPSIVVGHVDSTAGPAVFYRLRDLTPGDIVEVDRDDGSVARFRVTETIMAPKDDFPTERVYDELDGTTLRLITCGGEFDSERRSYRSNHIVFAEHLGNTAPTAPSQTTG
jgi:hypothetical protein